MLQTRKMSKEIKIAVEMTNEFLRMENLSSEEKKILEIYTTALLMKNNMYHGFNYYSKTENGLKLTTSDTGIVQYHIV